MSRYQCPSCGRAVCSTGPVYTAGVGTKARTYVYLRGHNTPSGVRCGGATARVIAPSCVVSGTETT